MRKQNSKKKLSLNKTTIVQLNKNDEKNVMGGSGRCILPTVDVVDCPTGQTGGGTSGSIMP